MGMGSAQAERARVAGKTSVTLLSVHKAAARLGARGTPFESTPWRKPPSYTSSTNTGECPCWRARPATCETPPTTLAGLRRTPRLSRICDDTGSRGLEDPRSLQRILSKTRNAPRSRWVHPRHPPSPLLWRGFLWRSLVRSPEEPRTYCDPLHLLRQKRRER